MKAAVLWGARDHHHTEGRVAGRPTSKKLFRLAQLGGIELKGLVTKCCLYDQINQALADLEHGKLRMGVCCGVEGNFA
jgi:Zn-dependent alcohol dehydrogenase